MNKDVVNRYERDLTGKILIDVAADKIEDLYSDFDRNAPFIRRDLNQDLVDYLIDSARELGPEPFTICFSLASPPDESRVARTKRSINNFFQYLTEIERQEVRRMVRRSLVLFSIGIALLFLSVWLNQWLGEERSVVANVFAEGLTIASWVSMWEALAIFLVEWLPHHKQIKLYQRLAATQPTFRLEAKSTMPPD